MATQADFPHAEILASVDWMFEHLSDARVKVIDARATRAYVESHIPGALVLEASAFKDERSGEPVLPDEFARTAGALGIQLEDTVVCYDDEGPVAARAWWAFTRFGHPDVRFLNGGLTRWTAAGYPLSTASAVVSPTTYALGQVHDELACSLPQAAVAHKRSDVIFWDTRSPGEYRGHEVRFGAPARPGHIGVWQSMDQKTGIRSRTGFEASDFIPTHGHKRHKKPVGTAKPRQPRRLIGPGPNGRYSTDID